MSVFGFNAVAFTSWSTGTQHQTKEFAWTTMLPTTLLAYLTQWLTLVSFPTDNKPHDDRQPNNQLTFELRHLHSHSGARVLFSDVPNSIRSSSSAPLKLRTSRMITHKPRSRDSFVQARWRSMRDSQSMQFPWDEDEVDGPNVEDRETLLLLAEMTYNAYVEPADPDWYDHEDDWPDVRFYSVCVLLRSH